MGQECAHRRAVAAAPDVRRAAKRYVHGRYEMSSGGLWQGVRTRKLSGEETLGMLATRSRIEGATTGFSIYERIGSR